MGDSWNSSLRMGFELAQKESNRWPLAAVAMLYGSVLTVDWRNRGSKGPRKNYLSIWRERHLALCKARGGRIPSAGCNRRITPQRARCRPAPEGWGDLGSWLRCSSVTELRLCSFVAPCPQPKSPPANDQVILSRTLTRNRPAISQRPSRSRLPTGSDRQQVVTRAFNRLAGTAPESRGHRRSRGSALLGRRQIQRHASQGAFENPPGHGGLPRLAEEYGSRGNPVSRPVNTAPNCPGNAGRRRPDRRPHVVAQTH